MIQPSTSHLILHKLYICIFEFQGEVICAGEKQDFNVLVLFIVQLYKNQSNQLII